VPKFHENLKVNDNESSRLDWFDINNIPSNLSPHTKNYLEKFGNILEEAIKLNLTYNTH